MKRLVTSALLCTLLCLTPSAHAKHHHHRDDSEAGAGNFDYYLLALSWAPNYCAGHPNDHSSECRIGGHTGFVLHGLWPQANSGAPPMSCSTASPVAADTVDHMLNFMPSRGLIQHEWKEHGTCSGLSAQEYFAKVELAFRNVHVPQQYQSNSSVCRSRKRVLLMPTMLHRRPSAFPVMLENWSAWKSAWTRTSSFKAAPRARENVR